MSHEGFWSVRSIAPSMWVTIVLQIVLVIVWAVRLEGRLTSVEREIVAAEHHLDLIDTHGSRGLGLLEERIKALHDNYLREQARIDSLVSERQNRYRLQGESSTPYKLD